MYYYGNSYGYGNSGNCCGATPVSPCCSYGNGYGSNYAIILVLFILLIIIIGCRNWNN